MIIWKRTTYFGKSKHVVDVDYDKAHGRISFAGVSIGQRGSLAYGAFGLTVADLDEIRTAIATGVPVIK